MVMSVEVSVVVPVEVSWSCLDGGVFVVDFIGLIIAYGQNGGFLV